VLVDTRMLGMNKNSACYDMYALELDLSEREPEEAPEEQPEEEECLHEESECGICNDCGAEVDWVSRVFRESD
jgi:hypothetical protein